MLFRSGRDALEMIYAGASGVSIGTANFADPSATVRIKNELTGLLNEAGFASLLDAVGVAHER